MARNRRFSPEQLEALNAVGELIDRGELSIGEALAIRPLVMAGELEALPAQVREAILERRPKPKRDACPCCRQAMKEAA